jgi:hypothetical protein
MLFGHTPLNAKTVNNLISQYSSFKPKFDSKLQKLSKLTQEILEGLLNVNAL